MFKILMVVLILVSHMALGKEKMAKDQKHQILRVGGDYRIQKIEKIKSNDFKILFENVSSQGKGERLLLRTNHLHFGLAEGATIRLSAEVLSDAGSDLEVTQMLLFLSRQNYGVTPVWILSSQHPSSELRGAKWLEMHAPQADYEVM